MARDAADPKQTEDEAKNLITLLPAPVLVAKDLVHMDDSLSSTNSFCDDIAVVGARDPLSRTRRSDDDRITLNLCFCFIVPVRSFA
jgi:hypothetical protein